MAETPIAPSEPPRTTGWAIAALGTSLSIFCPLLTLIGPLLAVRALVEIRAHPTRRGRGMAVAALWIGLACTLGWIATLFWWNGHVRQMLLHGPEPAIRAGMAGDVVTFKNAFTAAGANASDEQARAFLDALRSRYGMIISAAQDQSAPVAGNATQPSTTIAPATQAVAGQISGRSAVVPYLLTFERATIRADLRVTLFARGLAPRFEWIRIKDPTAEDLTYP